MFFFGRSFSRLFLFTHHLSSLVLQLSFTHSLSLFTPFLLFLSLSSAWPTYTLFLLSYLLSRATPSHSSPIGIPSHLSTSTRDAEATTLFAATTLKGDDGVHQLSPLALIDHDACRADLRRASSPPISTEMRKKFHCSLLLVLLALPCVNSMKERNAHGSGTTHGGARRVAKSVRRYMCAYLSTRLSICPSVRPSVDRSRR